MARLTDATTADNTIDDAELYNLWLVFESFKLPTLWVSSPPVCLDGWPHTCSLCCVLAVYKTVFIRQCGDERELGV